MREARTSHPHASEEAALSNLAHIVVGGLFAAVSVLAALEVLGVSSGWWFLWPGLLLVVGLFVPMFVLWASRAHGASAGHVLADPQQRQHVVLSGLVFAAGVGEMLARAQVWPVALRFVWPITLLVVGYLFTAHTQHGTSDAVARAVRAHRLLGGTLILAGVARGITVATGPGGGLPSASWIILLFLAAVQFLIYREPEGAFAAAEPHGHHGR